MVEDKNLEHKMSSFNQINSVSENYLPLVEEQKSVNRLNYESNKLKTDKSNEKFNKFKASKLRQKSPVVKNYDTEFDSENEY